MTVTAMCRIERTSTGALFALPFGFDFLRASDSRECVATAKTVHRPRPRAKPEVASSAQEDTSELRAQLAQDRDDGGLPKDSPQTPSPKDIQRPRFPHQLLSVCGWAPGGGVSRVACGVHDAWGGGATESAPIRMAGPGIG